MLQILWPAAKGSSTAMWTCFFFFWALNMFVVWRGIDTIRVLLNIKAPLLIVLGLLLLGWASEEMAHHYGASAAAQRAQDVQARLAIGEAV